MAKKRKARAIKSSREPCLPKMEEPPFSLDPEARLCIAGLWYNVEETLIARAVERAKDKKAIPKSVIVATAKELGLGKWLKDLPDRWGE